MFELQAVTKEDLVDYEINKCSGILSSFELEENIPINQDLLDSSPELVNKLKVNRIIHRAQNPIEQLLWEEFKKIFSQIDIGINPAMDKKIERYKQMNRNLRNMRVL